MANKNGKWALQRTLRTVWTQQKMMWKNKNCFWFFEHRKYFATDNSGLQVGEYVHILSFACFVFFSLMVQELRFQPQQIHE